MNLIFLSSKKYTVAASLIVVLCTLIFLINLENLDNILAADGKGYDLKEVKDGTYIVSANGYNIMFLTTGKGVIVIDAPPNIGDKIFKAISEVTNDAIKYLIYSHSHKDHIGSAHLFQPGIEIIAQKDTADILKTRNDPDRPIPTTTFVNDTTLIVGNKTIQLVYPGSYHQSGNIFIYIPEQKVLMAVDQLTPGAVPWKHLAATPDVSSLIRSYDQALSYDFDIYIPGHGNIGTKEDIKIQKEYVNDLKNNSELALKNVNFTEVTKNINKENNAAITETYFNALTNLCVDKTEEKWKGKLQGVGIWTDEHCEKMIQSIRVD